MGNKIKSVKLKNDYRTNDWVIQKGTVGSYNLLNEVCYFENDYGIKGFLIKDMLNNKTDLFEIEYEPERKFIDVRIEYEGDDIINISAIIERGIRRWAAESKNFKVTEIKDEKGI